MYPRRISNAYYPELGASLVDLICFRNNRMALQELRQWLGDEKFLEMVNLFSGSYVSLPNSKKLLATYYDYMSALAVARIRKARKEGDLKTWSEQENVLHSIARRTKRNYSWVYDRAKIVLNELSKTQEWMSKLGIWHGKYMKEGE